MENKSNKVLTIFVVCFYLFALGSFGIRARWVFAITLVTVSFVAMANIENLFIKISDYKKLWCFIYCVITILIFEKSAVVFESIDKINFALST